MTPLKLVVAAALVGSAAVVVYGLVMDRTGQAIAFTVAGLGVLGLSLAIAAVWFASAGIQAGRDGYAIRAILGGIFGGLFALAAAGALAGAVIFGLLTRSV